jgi:geranylgeranyl transferase type-2 subunit beta
MDLIDKESAVDFVLQCRNFDGGFGGEPLMESHAAYVFCCVGTLGICEALDRFD